MSLLLFAGVLFSALAAHFDSLAEPRHAKRTGQAQQAGGHALIGPVDNPGLLLGLLPAMGREEPKSPTGEWTGRWVLHKVDGPADRWKGQSADERQRAFEDFDIGISEGRLAVFTKDQISRASVTLDSKSQPKAIDVLPDGDSTPVLGLYEFQDDRLSVCFAKQGSKRPKELRAIAGEQSVFVLKRQTARIEEPIKDDGKRGSYIGIRSHRPRQIAAASGGFTEWTRLSLRLALVREGKINAVNHTDVGRYGHRDGRPFREATTIRIALEDDDTPEGRVTSVGCSGMPEGTGEGGHGQRTYTFKSVARQLYAGTIESGRTYIAYVEGDRAIDAASDMSLQDFAARNRDGNFVVVTVRLHWTTPFSNRVQRPPTGRRSLWSTTQPGGLHGRRTTLLWNAAIKTLNRPPSGSPSDAPHGHGH